MATKEGSKAGRAAKAAGAVKPADRIKNTRPDAMDFRDVMFVPTLIEVPTTRPLADYKKVKVPILDQGREGACTGFGLATVANYLLRVRRVVPDPVQVSARMLYENARRYDEWPGVNYDGSSARGAMKGWHKHGVCSERDWPYLLGPKDPKGLTDFRTSEALKRPLGAYCRVNHKDLIAMHAAIAEVGILYATATVHAGGFLRGKGKLAAIDYEPSPEHGVAGYPYLLVTGRLLEHYNVGTMTRRTALAGLVAEDALEIHPEDALREGVADGTRVRVESRWGAVEVTARLAPRISPGTLFLTFHFPETHANRLTGPVLDPQSKCPQYKATAVRVVPTNDDHG